MENTQSDSHSVKKTNFSSIISGDITTDTYSPGAVITLELVSAPAGFQRLKSDWNELQSSVHEGPRRAFGWLLRAYKHHYLKDSTLELSLLVGRHNGKVVMIWPLMKSCSGGITQLKYIEDKDGCCATILLADHPANKDWMQRAYSYLLSEEMWDSLILKSVRRHSLLLAFLREKRALCIETENGQDFNCLIARNLTGQAYNSLLQGQHTAYYLYKYIRTIYSSLM